MKLEIIIIIIIIIINYRLIGRVVNVSDTNREVVGSITGTSTIFNVK